MRPYWKPSLYVTPFIDRRQSRPGRTLEVSLLPASHPEYFAGGRTVVVEPHDRTAGEMLDIAASYRRLRALYIAAALARHDSC